MSTQFLNTKRKSTSYMTNLNNNLPAKKETASRKEEEPVTQSKKLSQMEILLDEKESTSTSVNNVSYFQVSTQNCIICNWRYPIQMTNEEKNAHLNYCIEGNGSQHRENYINSIRIIFENLKDKIENCVICGVILKMMPQKNKQYHISQCLENQEKN